MQGLGRCCFRITMVGCSTTKVGMRPAQARVVVSNIGEPEEEAEKRSKEKIRFLGLGIRDRQHDYISRFW